MKQMLYNEPFDTLTGGLHVPSVNALVSRPGMGRTKWALERAFYGSKSGTNTLFITLESSIQDNIERLFGIVGKKELTTHPMTTFHLVQHEDATIEDIKNIITENVITNNVCVVWIDSIDYLIPENGLFMKEEEDYIKATTSFKELAEELNICIVFTKQLNRTPEEREDNRPLMSDVTPAQTAHLFTTVIGLYRDELYHPDTTKPNTLEVSILKNEETIDRTSYEETFIKKELL